MVTVAVLDSDAVIVELARYAAGDPASKVEPFV